jgi:NAD(P)-dependent dehydrogenase (short-subunit alcohol dehydrogenase family)
MNRFEDTVALVSGGVRGIGASHVRGLVSEGAKVLIGDRPNSSEKNSRQPNLSHASDCPGR